MKKATLIFAILLRCLAANAQSGLPLVIEDAKMDAYLQNRRPGIITIQVNHAPEGARKVNIKCAYVTFGSNFQITKYYKTDVSGFIKINLEQNLPYQQIWLSVGNYLYAGVYVNADLKVTVDASQIKEKDGVFLSGNGITYSGIDGELNTALNKHLLYKRDEQTKLNNRLEDLCRARREIASDVFLQKTDSISQALNRIDASFIGQYPKYDWAIANETASQFYRSLLVSYWNDTIPRSLAARVDNHKPYFTSNDGVLFYSYLNTYRTIRVQPGIKNDIRLIDSLYSGPKADILKTFLLAKGKDAFTLTYPELLSSFKTGWCRRLAANELKETTIRQKHIDSLLASAKKLDNTSDFIGDPVAQLPFDARLYTLPNIKDVNDFIVNLRSKFKNKALVIDFWATWCAPCLQDMPFSKKLHEANKDLPVEYVYICTTSSSKINVWKNKIAELQLPGTHIFMDEKIVEQLKSSFNTAGSGFPTYVVIDTKGKLRPKAIQWIQPLDRDQLRRAIGL